MSVVLLDGQSLQVVVHRWDGARLRAVIDALHDAAGFQVEFSEAGTGLADQLRRASVFVSTTRFGPPSTETFAHPSDQLKASYARPEPAYSADDLAALTAFVGRGGGLLLLSNHGDRPGRSPFDFTRHDRVLATAFGVTLEPAVFAGPPPEAFPALDASCLLTEHPIIRGAAGEPPVRELVVGPCCALTGGATATPVVRLAPTMVDWRDGRAVDGYCFAVALAETPERQGRVVVVARSGFLGSEGTTFPGPGIVHQADNLRFVVNAVRWLAREL